MHCCRFSLKICISVLSVFLRFDTVFGAVQTIGSAAELESVEQATSGLPKVYWRHDLYNKNGCVFKYNKGQINQQDDLGFTLLHKTVNNNNKKHNYNIKLIKDLLENGADPNIPSSAGYTPLNSAVNNGKVEIARMLLDVPGIDVNAASRAGCYTPLLSAVAKGDLKLVEMLLKIPGIDVNIANRDGYTSLLAAASNGQTEIVKTLLDVPGIDVNTANSTGYTPLNSAVSNGHLEIAKMLIKKFANPNIANNASLTPLHMAVFNGYPEVVQLLINAGADLRQKNDKGFTALLTAKTKRKASNNREDYDRYNRIARMLEEALRNTASSVRLDPVRLRSDVINNKDEHGFTLLHDAVRNYDIKTMQELLDAGANPNTENKVDFTPLHSAAIDGYPDFIQFLINVGADQHRGNKSFTPLQAAKAMRKQSLNNPEDYNRYDSIVQILENAPVQLARGAAAPAQSRPITT